MLGGRHVVRQLIHVRDDRRGQREKQRRRPDEADQQPTGGAYPAQPERLRHERADSQPRHDHGREHDGQRRLAEQAGPAEGEQEQRVEENGTREAAQQEIRPRGERRLPNKAKQHRARGEVEEHGDRDEDRRRQRRRKLAGQPGEGAPGREALNGIGLSRRDSDDQRDRGQQQKGCLRSSPPMGAGVLSAGAAGPVDRHPSRRLAGRVSRPHGRRCRASRSSPRRASRRRSRGR